MRTADALYSMKSRALAHMRWGSRIIFLPPELARGGNLLYWWLKAADLQRARVSARVRENSHASAWLTAFPQLRSLTINRSAIQIRDKRTSEFYDQYGVGFSRESLNFFITNYMLSNESDFFDQIRSVPRNRDLTINIRRGDYYSVPEFRGLYSFDIISYLQVTLARVESDDPIKNTHVVSDDLEWCKTRLNWLDDIAPVSYPAPGSNAVSQLAQVAASPRLILTNSTFSYWGGYISTLLSENAGRRSGVWAPWFHRRQKAGGAAYQLDPRWHVIDTIPGGWDS